MLNEFDLKILKYHLIFLLQKQKCCFLKKCCVFAVLFYLRIISNEILILLKQNLIKLVSQNANNSSFLRMFTTLFE
jgi:hypothetical protein